MPSVLAKIIRQQRRSNKFVTKSLKRQGAIDAVERIITNGRSENRDPLRVSPWFKQQLRLTADLRLKHVLTTGASQISKSLANYLVAIDSLIAGQINIAWVYASRQSLINQQPSQFQAMVRAWRNVSDDLTIGRDSVFRFKIGTATANFTYANSASQKSEGGASEGKEQNAFQASMIFLEEKSSWKSNIDVSPRLGASKLPSKPIRELGTPGAGTGIEYGIKQANHNFEPGVVCPHCGQLSWLHPLGNLFKGTLNPKGELDYFTLRGEIKDFWGTEDNPYVACSHCYGDITDEIPKAQLYSRQSRQSVDEFLDELPEDEVYYPSVSIYLSPLLKVPDDPYRLRDLISEGLDPDVALIFHQNKLGLESKFSKNCISNGDYRQLYKLPPWEISKPVRIVGIDQGTEAHYLVELEVNPKNKDEKNIVNVQTIDEDGILNYLTSRKIDFGLIDNEPGRKSASDLSNGSNGKLGIADQKNVLTDVNKIKVTFGGIEIDCYAISNILFKEIIFDSFNDFKYRIVGNPHRKFEKHITSITRDIQTGEFLRPANHDDDFFFALMFAEAAVNIHFKNYKPMSASAPVGKPLDTLSDRKYGKQVRASQINWGTQPNRKSRYF